MMYRDTYNILTIDGESYKIAGVLCELYSRPDAGLFVTLTGQKPDRNQDEQTFMMRTFGTDRDVMIRTIDAAIRVDPNHFSFAFYTRFPPLEFISALARRYSLTVWYHTKIADFDGRRFRLYATFNADGLIYHDGQTKPTGAPITPVFHPYETIKHHESLFECR